MKFHDEIFGVESKIKIGKKVEQQKEQNNFRFKRIFVFEKMQ